VIGLLQFVVLASALRWLFRAPLRVAVAASLAGLTGFLAARRQFRLR
jgi:hypothetical protein